MVYVASLADMKEKQENMQSGKLRQEKYLKK